MSDFRLALVGLGNAAWTLHLPALAGQTSATLVGACDVDPTRRARVADRWQVMTFDDFDAMLKYARPNIVVVGTPPDTHASYCLRALANGADVICEKPFASSVDEARQVIAAAADAGRRVAVNHEFREMPIFRAVLDAVAALPTREVVFAQAWQMMDQPPWTEPGWRGKLAQRTLYEAGVHLVDLLLALFGERPIAVTATVAAGPGGPTTSDAIALATLEFPRGRVGQLVQNRLHKGDTQYFEVCADTGDCSLRASFGGRTRLSVGFYRSTHPHLRIEYGQAGIAWREVGHERSYLARNPQNPQGVATRALFSKTLAALRDGSPLPVSAEAGRDVLEVIAACYHAAGTGRRVVLDSPDSRELAGLTMGARASR